MGERYGQTGTMTVNTTTNKTMLNLTGSTAVIMKVYDLIFGPNVVPVSGLFIYEAERTTTTGTGTSVTPEPLDAAHGLAAEVAARSLATAEPTNTGAPALSVPMFSQATFRWAAAPGSELMSQLTANAGWGFASRSPALTTATRCTALHEE